MEPNKFDAFTKAIATPTSRRAALKTLVVTTVGGVVAWAGLGKVFAKDCDPPCSSGLTCCGGKCIDLRNDPKHCGDCNVVCASGLCVNGLCCPPGATKCGNACCSFTCCGGNTCVDTRHDINNCGSCGNKCNASQCQTCQNGTCVFRCTNGQVCQNGTCVTPTTTTTAPPTTTTTTTIRPPQVGHSRSSKWAIPG